LGGRQVVHDTPSQQELGKGHTGPVSAAASTVLVGAAAERINVPLSSGKQP